MGDNNRNNRAVDRILETAKSDYTTYERIDDPPAYAEDLPEPELENISGGGAASGTIYERWADEVRPWYVEDIYPAVGTTDEPEYEYGAVICKSHNHRFVADVDALNARLSAKESRWSATNPWYVEGRGLGPKPNGGWYPGWLHPDEHEDIYAGFVRRYQPLERRWAPRNASDLTIEELAGTGSQKRTNAFLDGEDGLVFHDLGTYHGSKTRFVARGPTGDILATIVLGRPSSRALDDGSTLEVYRLAAHEIAPKNTNSKLLGRARSWANGHGYEELISYANMDDQDGTCYVAAGFELKETTRADATGWQSREGRAKIGVHTGGGEMWTRGKFVAKL